MQYFFFISTDKAVQHERKPLLEKKEVTSSTNSGLHNVNETFASNANSNSATVGKQSFGTGNMNSLSSILPAHIFANFTSNVAQQGKTITINRLHQTKTITKFTKKKKIPILFLN